MLLYFFYKEAKVFKRFIMDIEATP